MNRLRATSVRRWSLNDPSRPNSLHLSRRRAPHKEPPTLVRPLDQSDFSYSFFAKLLDDFREENESILNRLRRAIDDARRSHALEMVHALKGASATIGATAVSRTAADLEDALRSAVDWHAPMAELERELSVVLDGVRAQRQASTGKSSASAHAGSVDLSVAVPILMELRQRLADNNLEAGRSFKKVRDAVGDCGHDTELEILGASIDQLDFDAAASHLNALARALSLSLPEA